MEKEKILDRINSPRDLKSLNESELTRLASEIRAQMIEVVSNNGGHLASSLGVVELTIALHRVFNTPVDKIIWDVGHQSYAHKILTGRKTSFPTIRQYGGLSGFPSPGESQHDAFGTGHAGNSISAALGMALARDMDGKDYHVIAVIGDGSLGTGMAFEAINHAGQLGTRLIVVLNDNGMSISPSVGALARWLNKIRLDVRYAHAKQRMKGAFARLPFGRSAWKLSKSMKHSVERVLLPNAFWEQLGFTYLGPLDGHNIREIEAALIRARDLDTKPVLIHVLTQKGKGYPVAEINVVKYHGVAPNGQQSKSPAFSQVFGEAMRELMAENKKIVAISAAMLEGTGLSQVASDFPGRVFDVGICEQHAVTLAAGLAAQGYLPVVAIYSTFLQRAYDQVIHDVCLQNLPVVFAIDRAGIVGEDGKTHQGTLDISYLRCVPNMVVASPADGRELRDLLYTAISSRKPFAIRYPRGNVQNYMKPEGFSLLPLGKGKILVEGKDLTIVAIGHQVNSALKAAEQLALEGIGCTVVNALFAKPLDSELIVAQAEKTRNLLTVEENTLCGGFGSAVTELFNQVNLSGIKIRYLGLPDCFIEHGPQELFRSLFNLDSEGIVQFVRMAYPELFAGSSVKLQEDS